MLGNHADHFFLGHARENVLAGRPNSGSRGYAPPDQERVSSMILAGGDAMPGMGDGMLPDMGGDSMPGMGGDAMPGMGALNTKTGIIIGLSLLAATMGGLLLFKKRR